MSDFNPRPSDKLTASERKKLDTSEFGIPQLREFPIHDAAHVRAAEAYFRYAPEEYKAQLARNILAKAVNSTLAVSNIRNRTYTNCEVYLIDYGYGNFKEKIHFME